MRDRPPPARRAGIAPRGCLTVLVLWSAGPVFAYVGFTTTRGGLAFLGDAVIVGRFLLLVAGLVRVLRKFSKVADRFHRKDD